MGDWVAPYGKGTTRDFVFIGHVEWRGSDDHEESVTMTFDNPGDGLQSVFDDPEEGSVLRLRSAPENGYAEKRWERSYITRPGIENTRQYERPEQCYFFRVRTTMDGDKLDNVRFGKIYGPIRVGARRDDGKSAISIEFKYFFNPVAKDTNLEFDQKRNLFQSLTAKERVYEP
jgi:hypothetical protein